MFLVNQKRKPASSVLLQPKRPLSSHSRRWRIALYSHDTMGLGHKRRNLLIAQTLGAAKLDADILLISGMRDASDLPTPSGVDSLTLPALHKRADGQYEARRMGMALEDIIRLRSQIILAAVQNFQPDVLIVDNVPRGAVRELDATLEYVRLSNLQESSHTTRCILGLRDILDTPDKVKKDWQRSDNIEAIRRYYDTIWVYGDPNVYDLRREYQFPFDITTKMRPLGYLDQRARLNYVNPAVRANLERLALPTDTDIILCVVGGGQDGTALAKAFAASTLPANATGVLLTGPFMPADVQQYLYAQAEQNPQLRIIDYLEEPTLLIERASRVISMGGYNTTCEILSFQKPALIVPRVTPRLEQWIRTDHLQKQGLVDLLHPEHVNAEAISHWLQQPVTTSRKDISINLKGLDNLLIELQKQLLIAQAPPLPHAS
ncbi:MAG: glycosyltransferase family protein [Leptolyngbyaceae cyanobacterium]